MSHVVRVWPAPLPVTAEARPVFQDPSRRRWHGFLTFAGSGAVTLLFLAATLWISVSVPPELPPLPDVGRPLSEPVTKPPHNSVDPIVPVAPAAALPKPQPEPAAATKVAAVESRQVPVPMERPASMLQQDAPQLVVEPLDTKPVAAPQKRQISSASIQVLDGSSTGGWVLVPGVAAGSIVELSR